METVARIKTNPSGGQVEKLEWSQLHRTEERILANVRKLEKGFNKVYRKMELAKRDIDQIGIGEAKSIMIGLRIVFVQHDLKTVARRLASLGAHLEEQLEIMGIDKGNSLLLNLVYDQKFKGILSQIRNANEAVIEKYVEFHKLVQALYDVYKFKQTHEEDQDIEAEEREGGSRQTQERGQGYNDDDEWEDEYDDYDYDEYWLDPSFEGSFVLETLFHLFRFFSKCVEIETEKEPSLVPSIVGGKQEESVQADADEEVQEERSSAPAEAPRNRELGSLTTAMIDNVALAIPKYKEFLDRLEYIAKQTVKETDQNVST